jgi:hypothetical protein
MFQLSKDEEYGHIGFQKRIDLRNMRLQKQYTTSKSYVLEHLL